MERPKASTPQLEGSSGVFAEIYLRIWVCTETQSACSFSPSLADSRQMNVDLIPTRTDNYVFVLSDQNSPQVAVVDPSDFAPVYHYLQSHQLVLNQIFVTHHHPDHVGGIRQLKQTYGCLVVANKKDQHRIDHVDHWVEDGDIVNFGKFEAKVVDVPGHTLGHNAYYFESEGILFSGDTIFVCGCGRLFEGTPKMMLDTLMKLASLPDDTIVYCTHEYTLSNLEFARHLEPDNPQLKEFEASCAEKRAKGLPTVPTSIGREKCLNPFFRAHEPGIKASVALPDADIAEVFAELRRRKDFF